MKNKSYVLVVVCYSLIFGNVTAIGSAISSLTDPYNYHAKDNSIVGAAFISFGITGSIVIGILLDKYHYYKKSVVVISIMSFTFLSVMIFTLPYGSALLFGANIGVWGLFAVPIVPVSFAFSVELTYPTPEAVTNGMMIMASKLYGAILSGIGGIIAQDFGPLYTIGLFMTMNF
jgi:FLVCR family feline leukemia virus subgroup C receptor-related protein